MAGVRLTEIVSKEKPATTNLWLNNRTQSAQVMEKLCGRAEVKEVTSASVESAGLTALLHDTIHAKR